MKSYPYGSLAKIFCRIKTLLVAAFLSLGVQAAYPQPDIAGRRQLFDFDWRFALGDFVGADAVAFDDSEWKSLDLPHDWSIEGQFDASNPMGNDGGYLPAGIGWYRKSFDLAPESADKKVGLYFEGVYMNSEIFVNGRSVGRHPYGYTSFFLDITPYIVAGGKNILAVRVDNSEQKNCRWYSGSGIYRHVWLIQTDEVHFEHWGIAISTPEVSPQRATVRIGSAIDNQSGSARRVMLNAEVIFNGRKVGETSRNVTLQVDENRTEVQTIEIPEPALWSPDSPNLYRLQVSIAENGRIIDRTTETFGIRKIEYDAANGFRLNGVKMKLFGGCVHHDNGILGAAAYDRAEERRAELLKKAGFNAVRTSHNPPSEAFLDACDRVGLLVIDEAFDGWRDMKNTYDYSTVFDEWWQHDIESMVRRDRNHPSVFCWSTGNEVIERKKIEVITTAERLADHVRLFDPTRPVTSALASWDRDWEIYDPLAAVHGIVGYNYLIHKAIVDHQRAPERVIMQTESYPRDAFGNWAMVNDNDYIIGDFVWTAMDYLGESGIGRYYYAGETEGEHYQRDHYPWHGAYCGDIDLTGWRKPISHYREMLFNTGSKLYMAVREPDGYRGEIKQTQWSVWPTWESWNWSGHEGKDIEVEICSKYDSVRLYLNDKPIGERPTGREQEFKAVFTVPYLAGELKATGIENGREVEMTILRTAGKEASVRLTADRTIIAADGQDLAFVTVEVVDRNGNLVPDAANLISFSVKGECTVVAVGNADLKDTDSYSDSVHKVWKGRALVVVRSTQRGGKITLKAVSEGLRSSTLTVESVK